MGLIWLLAEHLLQCRSSLCIHPGNGLLLWCFYTASLWLRRFLLVDRRGVEFASSFLFEGRSKTDKYCCVSVFCAYTFKNSTDSQNLWCGSISPEAIMILSKYDVNSGFYAVAYLGIVYHGHYGGKCYTLVVLGLSEVAVFREGRMHPFIHLSTYRLLIIYGIIVSEQYVVDLELAYSTASATQMAVHMESFCSANLFVQMELSSLGYWRLECLFWHICRICTKTNHHNYMSMSKILLILKAKEMRNGLIFPRVKQCNTIHDEWLFFACPNSRMNAGITWFITPCFMKKVFWNKWRILNRMKVVVQRHSLNHFRRFLFHLRKS